MSCARKAKLCTNFIMPSSPSTFARSIIASAESFRPQGTASEKRALTAVIEMEWHLSAPPAVSCKVIFVSNTSLGSSYYLSARTHACVFPESDGLAGDVLREIIRVEARRRAQPL